MFPSLSRNIFTETSVWSHSVLFFLSGFETTSNTLTYVIYELAQNKEIQQRARESVQKAIARHNGEFSYEALSEMHYLEQCIKETLRMYPIVPVTRRIPLIDYQVPNSKIVLEKGTRVYIPIYGVHYDPEIYPSPLIFDPDRFSPEQVAKRHPLAFLPFGDGPRMCIGLRFAIFEIKAAIAKLLLSYEVELDRSKTSIPPKFNVKRITLTPADGVFVEFKKL